MNNGDAAELDGLVKIVAKGHFVPRETQEMARGGKKLRVVFVAWYPMEDVNIRDVFGYEFNMIEPVWHRPKCFIKLPVCALVGSCKNDLSDF